MKRILLLAALCLFTTPVKAATYAVPNNGGVYVYGDFAAWGGSIGASFSYQISGGQFYNTYTATNPSNLPGWTEVRIDVNQTGQVWLFGCNALDAHCGQGNRVNTGFGIYDFDGNGEGFISISTLINTIGATPIEVSLTVSLQPGFTIEFAPRVAAVPEPATWAMMLLGFAGISFMAYRRRQTNTPQPRSTVAMSGFDKCRPI